MPRGGARPGAGRKKKSTEEQQASRRDVVLEVVTPEKWAEAVGAMVREAANGNAKAFAVLAPYVVGGAPKQQIEVSGPRGGPIPVQSFDYDAALAPLSPGPVADP